MRSVVVTGVASGIGLAIARRLVSEGVRVFGSVLRAEEAEALQAEWGAAFVPLVFDVTDAEGVAAAAHQVGEALGGQRLMGLVNNAGIAEVGPLAMMPMASFERQLAVNLTGPVRLSQAFAPHLGLAGDRQGPPGRIVMMGSVAGLVAWPFMGGYVASKHGLEGVASVLRRELKPYGIHVALVGPGSVATPIWGKARELAAGLPWETWPYAEGLRLLAQLTEDLDRKGLAPEAVAAVVWEALSHPWPQARYAPVQNPLEQFWLPAFGPQGLVDLLLAQRFGLDQALPFWPPAQPEGPASP